MAVHYYIYICINTNLYHNILKKYAHQFAHTFMLYDLPKFYMCDICYDEHETCCVNFLDLLANESDFNTINKFFRMWEY